MEYNSAWQILTKLTKLQKKLSFPWKNDETMDHFQERDDTSQEQQDIQIGQMFKGVAIWELASMSNAHLHEMSPIFNHHHLGQT